MSWNLSCPDWRERLVDGRSLVPDLPLYTAEAERAVAIFNKLRLADVVGTPSMAEAGGEWFRAIVRAMFGCVDPATQYRHIKELMLLVPKKNNKTTGGALLMLTALAMNQRPRAPFVLMAPVQDTADEAFAAAEGAIELDPVLEKVFHVRSHLKTIVHRETKADLQIMTFDPDYLTGKKFVGTLLDELHVVAKNVKATKALRQVRGGMVPFPESFLAFITTMPDDPPTGVMKQELDKARNIRDGKAEGKTLPVLYEFPPEIQKDKEVWSDPATWQMVNPNMGLSVQLQALVDLHADAESKGDAELRGWASQHLNLQIGLAMQGDHWAGADYWEANADPTLTLEELIERCEVAVVGIDGGGLDDLLGLCIMGRERVASDVLEPAYIAEDGTEVPEKKVKRKRWLSWHHAWAHEIVLERRKDIAAKLLDFKAAGCLSIVQLPGRDVAKLADRIMQVREAGLLPEENAVGVDAAGISDIVDELESPDRGLTKAQIVAISQGWRLNGSIKTTERRLAGGQMVHGGTPLMAWCVGNAKAEGKGNAISITKQTSGNAKIDPLMATFDAVSLLSLNPVAMVIGEDYEMVTT
jgi:phage terminase large subunit-like protein